MPKITLTCDQCGETIEKWPSRVKKSKHHFCSSECFHEWTKEAFRGEKNPMFGKHHSKETRRKLSESHKGKKGYWEGKYRSKETRRKMSEALTEENHPMYGKHLSEEHRRKLSEAHKGLFIRENNPQWRGGISFEPYSPEFNIQLKRRIRVRDNYTCQLCGKPQEENGRDLAVHHIDYDKENNAPSNLITLCDSCHNKTNYNRDKWKTYFNDLMALGVLKND